MTTRTRLWLSDELSLPLEVGTEVFAILARRGAGKTFCASVFAEEMIAAGIPVVILDYTGVWWGLRASADGKGVGLPVVILGGRHADVPLPSSVGRDVARFFVEEPRPLVLDLSLLPKPDRVGLAADFLETIFEINQDAIHVIVDEADAYAPQQLASHVERRSLAAMKDVVQRGRAKGIGATLITQRPAVISKDILTQAGILIALQMTAPQDQKAVMAWVEANGTSPAIERMLASLPSLPVGAAWVYGPLHHKEPQRISVRQRTTYDSSATPKVGAARGSPALLAPVDLGALGARLAAAATDPTAPLTSSERNQVRLMENELQILRSRLASLPTKEIEAIATAATQLRGIALDLDRARKGFESRNEYTPSTSQDPPAQPPPPRPSAEPTVGKRRGKVVPPKQESSSRLGRCERAVLRVLAERQGRSTSRTQVAILSGYSNKSSSLANALGSLRTAGLLGGTTDSLGITPSGLTLMGPVDPLPRGRALRERWGARLSKCERAVLDALSQAYPAELGKQGLSNTTGYSLTSSSLANALGRLKSLELIERTQRGFRLAAELTEGDRA